MNTDNETSLYAQFHAFTQKFTYVYEDEVMGEINRVLQSKVSDKQIKMFKVIFDVYTKHYNIEIKMSEFDIGSVWKTFRDIHQAIELGSGVYIMKETNNMHHYLLVSLRENVEGIYCEIDFTA